MSEPPAPPARRYVLRRQASKTYRVDYGRELNEQQREVVFAPDGPCLVVAGAGSGKTRTLVYRVARLIEDGAEPHRFLLLTFTNRAAREMTRRVEALVGTDLQQMAAGTFHSVAARLLRPHAETLGYGPRFAILDREDARELLEAATSDCGIPVSERRFPKGDLLQGLLSLSVNTGRPLPDVVAADAPHFLPLLPQIEAVVRRFFARKVEANGMDFDDLLLNWRRLLAEHPEVRRATAHRFRHVLVDEYQDVNHLQASIVDLVGRPGPGEKPDAPGASPLPAVMAVGDDAQSIYSFRGADFEAFLTFPDRYPGTRVCRLETNYRSTPQILALAGASIAFNARRFPKELVPVRPDGVPVAVVGASDVRQQAEFVAQRLLELRDEGIPLPEMAVLYRAHYQSLELQMELTRRGIPFEIRSGVRFFEQQHVKDVLAHLRLAANPKDELSFKRAVKLLPKVGERTAATLWTAVSEAPDPLAAFLALDLGKAPAGARAGLRGFCETMRVLRGERYLSSPAGSIRHVVSEGGYSELARAKFPNSSARLDDLEALAQFAEPYGDVDRFLSEVALLGDPAGEDVVAGEKDDEKLVLSTVHQAKGLEWRAVFVIGVVEERFPNARASRSPEGLEEERRLFHVAVTRAKDELTLVHPLTQYDRSGVLVLTEPSQFLRELPADLYERWTLEESTLPATPAPASLPAGPGRAIEPAHDWRAEDDPTVREDDAPDEGGDAGQNRGAKRDEPVN